MIAKTVLTAMAVGLFTLWVPPSVGHGADFNATIDYEPVRIEPLPQDQKRHQEKDRIHRDEMETKAQDARRASAYRESKAVHRKKVKGMRKKAGLKSHNSWQLNH